MKGNEQKRASLLSDIECLKKTIESKELAITEYQQTIQMIPVWREVFEKAPLNIKKQLLSILIEKIIVKDLEVSIHFKIDIDSFLNMNSNLDNEFITNSSSIKEYDTYRKMIAENVKVSNCRV